MGRSLQQLSADEIQSLPIDRLGILVLKHLVDTKEWNSHNFLNSGRIASSRVNSQVLVRSPQLACVQESSRSRNAGPVESQRDIHYSSRK